MHHPTDMLIHTTAFVTVVEHWLEREIAQWVHPIGGGGSVMVWAAIAHGYFPPLVVFDGNLNAQRYRDDILAHHVIPVFHNNANISIIQHDNATSHTARDTVNFLRTNSIDLIDYWPANKS